MKVAVTDWLELMVILQAPVPEQAPLQPAKVEPVDGTAVSPTIVPAGNEVPVGNDLIAPLPLPLVADASVKVDPGDTTKVVLSNDPP